jgi:hypothetical protein
MALASRSLAKLLGRRLVQDRMAAAGAMRAGMGLPVGTGVPPRHQLPESDELTWDDGTPHPEPCPDIIAPHISDTGALGLLLTGMGLFLSIGLLAAYNDKASRIPWTPREYPYENLRVELGGDPNAALTDAGEEEE